MNESGFTPEAARRVLSDSAASVCHLHMLSGLSDVDEQPSTRSPGDGHLQLWFDVGVDADDHGLAVDFNVGGFVAVTAGDRERLAGG